MEVIIAREYLATETIGEWSSGGIVLCKTLELPWKENARNISCIPEGKYQMVKEEFTVKHPYPHFRILNVKDRSGILVHKITYVKDLRGCIGVGEAFKDLNKDGVPDIIGSTIALQKLYESYADKAIIDLIIKKRNA